ncbi:MAG: TldD/PmbA family protein [Chloroflexi bacterium]|nr:TldD/PmbA family protein [Chloroflexota bacterium]
MEEVLEKARRRAEEAEVFSVHHTDTALTFEANRLKMVETRETSGLALRLILGGHIGFSSTTNLSDKDALVEHAVEMAPFGVASHLELPSASAYAAVDVYDPQVETVGLEEMHHLGQRLIDEVWKGWPEAQFEGQVIRRRIQTRLINSRGCHTSLLKTVFSVYMEGVLIQDTDMLFVAESEISCHPIKDASHLRDSLLLQLERASRIDQVPTRPMPVLFTPRGVAGLLLEPLLSGFSGKMALRGTSPLIGRIGERVVDERVSLWDDPTRPYVPGSRPFDDEGVPSQATPLLQDGQAMNFLYDLQTAAQAGARTTASASRSLTNLPSPAPAVLLLAPGDASFEDMLAGMGEGLVVERLLGAGQGNTLGGDFNANVLLGYHVRGGQIAGRAKDVMVSGNVYDVLNNVVAIGKDTRWLGGFLNAPALYCDSVAVSARG